VCVFLEWGCAHAQNVTLYNFVAIFGMHVVAVVGALAMQTMPRFENFIGYQTFTAAMSDATYWLIQIVGVVACIAPVEAVKCFVLHYVPNNARRLLLLDMYVRCSACAPTTHTLCLLCFGMSLLT